MFVVTVKFEIKPQHAAAFKEAALQNAAESLRTERDCHRFDVCFAIDGRQCFLYELYCDEPAFAAHQATGHFDCFSSLTKEMINDKRLETYVLVENSASLSAFEVAQLK